MDGDTTSCLCQVCNRVFASEMAFTVHRYGCRMLNEHWMTNLVLLPNGRWGTHEDRDLYERMAKMRTAGKEAR